MIWAIVFLYICGSIQAMAYADLSRASIGERLVGMIFWPVIAVIALGWFLFDSLILGNIGARL